MDEVSVYSLIASRLGAIAREFTMTETSSLETEANGSATVGKGPIKGTVGSKSRGVETVANQIVRKSIIQSTFRELFEYEKKSIVPRTDAKAKRPRFTSLKSLEQAAKEGRHPNWLIPESSLKRGRLIEVEVELEAESTFRISAVLSNMVDLVAGNEQLFGAPASFSQGAAINVVFEKLLGGLVPIRGRIIEYRVIGLDGRNWLVHKDLLGNQQLQDLATRAAIVGVAESSLFWRDLRRVLFTSTPYSILCRVGRDGLHATWSPIKLVDVLNEVLPDVGRELGQSGEGLLAAVRSSSTLGADADRETAMSKALTKFAIRLAGEAGQTWDEAAVQSRGLPTPEQTGAWRDVAARQGAFTSLRQALDNHFTTSKTSEELQELRNEVLTGEGLRPDGTWGLPSPSDPDRLDEPLIDVELIAIYW